MLRHATVLGFVLISATTVVAQERREEASLHATQTKYGSIRGAPGLRFKSSYCESVAVRKDLGVSQAQQEEIHSLFLHFVEALPAGLESPHMTYALDRSGANWDWDSRPNLDDVQRARVDRSERRENFWKQDRERMEKIRGLIAKEEEAIQKILEPKQFERLNQIIVQQTVPAVFFRSDVADKLILTAEQRQKMRTRWIDELGKERDAIMGYPSIDTRALRGSVEDLLAEFDRIEKETECSLKALEVPLKKRTELVREAEQRAILDVLALLTDEQRAIWKTMTGEPVDLNPKP